MKVARGTQQRVVEEPTVNIHLTEDEARELEDGLYEVLGGHGDAGAASRERVRTLQHFLEDLLHGEGRRPRRVRLRLVQPKWMGLSAWYSPGDIVSAEYGSGAYTFIGPDGHEKGIIPLWIDEGYAEVLA